MNTAALTTLAGAVAKNFGRAVVERWSRYRAEQFFKGFVEALGTEVAPGSNPDEVDRRLTAILADDKKTEVLYDAYRRVCFTKSRTLGPRIIGLLTGELTHEGRMADDAEERIFAAAEVLSDGEFLDFIKTYHEHRAKAEGVTDLKAEHCMLGESVIVRWCEESSDMSFGKSEFDVGSLDFDQAFGPWAVRLSQSGLLAQRVQQQFFDRRSASQDGTLFSTSVITKITFHPGCARLYDLVVRSLEAEGTNTRR